MRLVSVLTLCCLPVIPVWGMTALPDWAERIHIGGNGAVRISDGQSRAQLERNNSFSVNQLGLVFDVDLGPDMSFWYDFGLVREGQNRAPSLQQIYVQGENLLGLQWLNARLGRTFIPFGEEYLRWNAAESPVASISTAFPWALDEGVVVFGDILPEGKLAYAASLQNGNKEFNFDDNPNKTVALKLSAAPLPWLYASASYLNLGKQGNNTTAGSSEWWLSGFRIQPLGTTKEPSGASSSKIVTGQALEGNLKLRCDLGRAWLSYGYFHHNDGGGDAFDRDIRYFTSELLGYLPRTEQKAYAFGRYSVIGTFSPTLGYRFAGTELAFPGNFNNSPYDEYKYDQRDLYRYSLGLGYRLSENTVAKLEHTWENSHVIEAAKTAANLYLQGRRNFLIAELAFQF